METVNGHANLLRNGRASNIEEAILWYQGEVEASRDYYVDMPNSACTSLNEEASLDTVSFIWPSVT